MCALRACLCLRDWLEFSLGLNHYPRYFVNWELLHSVRFIWLKSHSVCELSSHNHAVCCTSRSRGIVDSRIGPTGSQKNKIKNRTYNPPTWEITLVWCHILHISFIILSRATLMWGSLRGRVLLLMISHHLLMWGVFFFLVKPNTNYNYLYMRR